MKTFKQFLTESKLTAGIDVPGVERRFLISNPIPEGTGDIYVNDDLHGERYLMFYNITSKPQGGRVFQIIAPNSPILYGKFIIEHPNTHIREEGRKRTKGVGGKKDLQYKPGWTDDHIIFGSPQDHIDTRIVRIPFQQILDQLSKSPEKIKYIKIKPDSQKMEKILNDLIIRGNEAMTILSHDRNSSAITNYLSNKYSSKEKMLESGELVAIPSKIEIQKETERVFGSPIVNWRQVGEAANNALRKIYPKLRYTDIIHGKSSVTDMPSEFWTGKDRGQGTTKSYFMATNIYGDSVSRVLEPISDWYQRSNLVAE